MVTYKILNTANACYDPVQLQKMSLLYEGGYKIMDQASVFMTKLSIETSNSFNERLKCASYMPYLSQFVDQFASGLFSDELLVKEAADSSDANTLGGTADNDPFYKLFSANCDMMNNSFHNFSKDTFTESLYSKSAYIGVDFQKLNDEDKPANLLEEEEKGLDRAYLYDIDPVTVIDWKRDEASEKFLWIKLRNERIIQDKPLDTPMKQVEFKLWTLDNNVARWDLYQSKPIKLTQQFKDSEEIPLVDGGETSFHEIPVFSLNIPAGLHLGDKLGPVVEEYFQRRSFLVSNMNKTCIAIPVVSLGPEISAPGGPINETQSNPNRAAVMRMQLSNQGYTIIGSEDDIDIKEAHGHSHSLVDAQLKDLREQMHQVVHQMAQSSAVNKQSSGRSASSKQEDRHSTEILLTAYGRVVKDFVKEIYQCIAEARGEGIVWNIQGLSSFVEEDRQDIIAEVTSIAGTQTSILTMLTSKTFQKKYILRLSKALIGTMSPEEELQMQAEIETDVEAGKVLPPDPTEPDGDEQDNSKGSKKKPVKSATTN